MREFQDKKKRKESLYSLKSLFLLVIIALVLLKAVANIYMKERESRVLKMEAEARLFELSDRQDTLAKEIDKLKTPEGIEEEIRSKLNVVKPGEKIITVVDEPESVSTSTDKGFFEKVFDKVKSVF